MTPPAAREAPEPEPVEPAAHAPEAAEAQVSLAVTSRPSGATITRLDTGAVVGRTPLETQLAKGTGPLKLRVELAGYRPVERTVPLTEDQDVSVSLQPEREARPKTKPAPRSKPQTEDPDAPLDPFATP